MVTKHRRLHFHTTKSTATGDSSQQVNVHLNDVFDDYVWDTITVSKM